MVTRHFCIALAMSHYGLESHQTIVISSLAGLRIETNIGQLSVLVVIRCGGLCSTESPDDCESYLGKIGFHEVAINGYRLNALSAVDPMMLSPEEFLPGEFKKL